VNHGPVKKNYFIFPVIFSLLFSGCEKDDFISSQPDSNIIFLSGHYENSTGWELMIMRKDGTHQSRITDLTTICEKPVISNSGEKVLFVHFSNDSFYELYSVNIDGTSLTLIDRAEYYCGSADWSSDDSKIVYSKYVDETPGDDSPPLYLDPTNDIVLYVVATQEKKILTDTLNNISPGFSPDDRIAFTRTEGTLKDIYLMDIDGSEKQLLVPNGCDPVWSPDGQRIAYTGKGENQSPQVFVVHNDGSNIIQLTSIYLMNYYDTNPVSFGNYNPGWTPDGKKIIYQSDIDQGLPEIFIMTSSGTSEKRLTNTYRRNESPEISSDGYYILFSSTRNLAYEGEIYLMDIEGQSQVPLSNRAGDECFPVYVY